MDSRVSLSIPRVVGRDRPTSQLLAALREPPAVVLVEGEAGIGKSRLIQECLASADLRGRRVLVGACPPHREPATLAPIVDALRHAGTRLPALRLTPLAGALRPLFPEWAGALPPAPEPLADPAAARYRLFRALAELTGGLGTSVLAVEDLHWADPVSLEFLLFLATRQGNPHRLSLVASYRPEDLPAGSLVRRLSSRASGGTTPLRLSLPPLTMTGTAELASSMLGGEPVSRELASFLHEQTGGVPLAVEESLRLLADRADLARPYRSWQRRSERRLGVPPTLRDATLERVARLSGSARQVLEAAAVLGEPAGERLLGTVAGLSGPECRAGAAAAVASGLLREDPGGRLAFRHVLPSTAVYEAIPAGARRRLHRRAGSALTATDSPPATALTRHFRAAGSIAEWLRYAERAATEAVAAGDHAAAVDLLADLVTAEPVAVPDRVRVAGRAATAALSIQAAGSGRRRQMVRGLRQLLGSARLAGDQRAGLGNLLGRLLNQLGETGPAFIELARAIPRLPDRREAARSMNLLGWPRAGPWPAATHLRWLRRAAEQPLDGASAAERLGLLVDRAAALLQLGANQGWSLVPELPARVSGQPARFHLARGLQNIGDAALLWGRYEQARRLLREAQRLAEADQLPRVRDCALANLVYLDWVTGAWAGLDERITALVDGADTEPGARQKALLVRGLWQATQGSRLAASEQFQQLLDQVRQQGAVSRELAPAAALARLRLIEGDAELALKLTEEPIQTVIRKRIWVWATELAPVRVDALLRCGDDPAAQRLVAGLGNGLRGRDAPGPRAALGYCRAALAAHRGEPARAAAGFARAARAWAVLPRPYEALLARERRAGCLRHAGEAGAAEVELRGVTEELRALGATGDADRVAAQSAGRAGEPRQRGYGAALSPREQEVVRLVATGMTNRQIAQALNKTPGTVAQQLQSAMRKLGVSTRTAVAVSTLALDHPNPTREGP